jgi:hypothetical protein
MHFDIQIFIYFMIYGIYAIMSQYFNNEIY